MAKQQWQTVAEVGPGIRRISTGQRTAWFLPAGDVGDLTHRWPGARSADLLDIPVADTVPEAVGACADTGAVVDGRPADVLGRPRQDAATGLVVPRFPGGLLADALRGYAGLTIGQTLAVLGACLEALCAAPDPSPGRLRCHRHAFAVDESGAIHLVPGHTVPVDDVTCEAVEFGQLAYLSLTGLTWEELGMPVRDLTPAVPEPLAGIVIDLLEAEPGGGPELGPALLAQLSALGEPEQIPFVPAEAEVSVSEAVTAQLRVDASVASALSRAYARRQDDETPARRNERAENQNRSGVGRLRSAAGARGSRRKSKDAQTPETVKSRRTGGRRPASDRRRKARSLPTLPMRRGTLIGAALAVLLSLTGVAVLTGLIDPGGRDPQPASAEHTPRHTEGRGTESAATASGPADPRDAFAALTRQREQAYQAGDATALAELTVPGSPAAAADSAADVAAFGGYEVSIDIESSETISHSDDRAQLHATTRTRARGSDGAEHDYGSVSMRVDLRRDAGRWRVYDAVER